MPNPDRNPLTIDPRPYRRRGSAQLDVELVEAIDERRGPVARSTYLEPVLEAAMTREHEAEKRYARLARRARGAGGTP
jgi:hypothetical protein